MKWREQHGEFEQYHVMERSIELCPIYFFRFLLPINDAQQERQNPPEGRV